MHLLEICPEGIEVPLPLSATFPLAAHRSGRAWKPGGNHCSYFSCEETGLQSSLVEGAPPSVTYRKLLLGDKQSTSRSHPCLWFWPFSGFLNWLQLFTKESNKQRAHCEDPLSCKRGKAPLLISCLTVSPFTHFCEYLLFQVLGSEQARARPPVCL